MLAVYANVEVKLNDYHYPSWAHTCGWIITGIILSPLIIFFEISLSKYNFTRIWQPADSWLPAIAPPKENNDLEFVKTASSNAKLLGSEYNSNEDQDDSPRSRVLKRPPSEALFNIKESEETAFSC